MSNSNRKCKYCLEYKSASKGIKHPIGWFCSQQHALNFASEQTSKRIERQNNKVKQARAKEIKVNKAAVKELNRKTIKWQHKQTQPVFNKLRRLQELKWFDDRGLEPVCISCQKTIGNDQWCNGHFKTVGANSGLRYDFKNSYLQHNYNCNQQKSGDIDGYKKGLIARFGEKEGQEIIDYCETNNAVKKLTWEEIENLRIKFNLEIRIIK